MIACRWNAEAFCGETARGISGARAYETRRRCGSLCLRQGKSCLFQIDAAVRKANSYAAMVEAESTCEVTTAP